MNVKMISNSNLQLLGVNLVVKFVNGWSHGSPRPMNMNEKLIQIISKSEAFFRSFVTKQRLRTKVS